MKIILFQRMKGNPQRDIRSCAACALCCIRNADMQHFFPQTGKQTQAERGMRSGSLMISYYVYMYSGKLNKISEQCFRIFMRNTEFLIKTSIPMGFMI